MCGRQQATVRASIEGSLLSVCEGCGKYGKIAGRIHVATEKKKEEKTIAAEEETEFVVANIGTLLKGKRESLGLKQEEFARKIAVKESILHKIETGHFIPGIGEAKRIEKALGLRLTETVEAVENAVPQAKKDQLTLGDMIKIKKK